MNAMKRVALILLVSLLGVLGLAGQVAAQGAQIIAVEVDRTALTTDEAVALTVTVDQSAGATDPQMPPLDDFNLLGTTSGTQISIVNGDMSVQLATTYYLQPRTTGELVIGPVTTTVNGQTISTDPILLSVAQGTGQIQPSLPTAPGMPPLGSLLPSMPGSQTAPPTGGQLPPPDALQGQEYYAEAFVDKTNPYQGQQIIYTFRFYQGASLLQDPNYEPPSFTGFWHDQVPEQATYTTEAGGRTYFVTELQTILFPTVTGDVTIDPATLEIPGGFFSPGGVYTTDPVTINVRSLPPNPPGGFTGGVGEFDIQATVDSSSSEVNDAVTLQVTLTGTGNMPTLADLTWDVGPQWRAFDPQVETNSDLVDGRLQGSRIYEQLLVPIEAGELTIPAIPFSYFDPETESYVSIATDPLTVQVAPDSGAPTAPIGDGSVVTAATTRLGLQPMKAAPASWRSTASPLVQQPAYWLLFLAPVLAVGGFAVAQRYRQGRRATAGDRLRRQALGRAQTTLRQAEKAEDPYALAHDALYTYLTDALGQPATGLTQHGLARLLRQQGAVEAEITRLLLVLRQIDLGRYAPATSNEQLAPVLTELEAVLTALDIQLQPQES